ncbi:TolB family protein [Actinoplanes sp. NPDC020271]|uniref:TolB family protein n=1 Tax=Actinoplanes sp. NPDC020271 TaxID=3363896 RepID=UPI00378B1363
MASARTLAERQKCRIWTYDVSTDVSTPVHTSSSVLFEAPNWSADGDLIVNGDGLLWRLPVQPGAVPVRIPIDGVPGLNNDHVLGPGDTIFVSADDGHLYEASLHGGVARRVTHEDRMHFLHGVSPDGATLAYVGIEEQRWDTGNLWTIGAGGGTSTRLTFPGGPDDGPEYTPDGSWIYFNTERFTSSAQIARIRPDGSSLEQLTFDERVNWFPHFSPDGQLAVYLSYPPGTQGHPADLPVELRLVTGGDWQAARTVVAPAGGQGTINVNSWAPDSRRFAYVDYPFETVA